MAASIYLRQSNGTLQEELRKTNISYTEEKTALRSHLSNLRLDLSELHHDNRTVTTDGSNSRLDTSVGSESELKRLAEFDAESGRSLQLPNIKNLQITTGKKDSGSNNSSHRKDRNSGSNTNTARSTKTLRFNGDEEHVMKSFDYDATDGSNTNNNNNNTHNKQENQKFLELQKNQEVLRNIGRANLKEKRQSLIRLPTISSAKKRNSLWDSGNNVSRPNGQSTSFEQNLKLYVEDSIILSKRAFKIPSIKDSQRSEILLSGRTKRPSLDRRKVQFMRPRPEHRAERNNPYNPALDVSVTEVSSLNTTLADVSLGDNTLGNITFDEEAFNKQLASKHDQTSSSFKLYHNHHNNNNNSRRLNQSSTSPLQPINESDLTASNNAAKSCQDNKNKNSINNSTNNNNTTNGKVNRATNNPNDEEQLTLPPIQIKTLARKNLKIHDLNNMRTSPTLFPKLRLSPESYRSVKDSDRSVGTKLSQMSQETESWKSTYVQNMDPDKRNKTLTEIMFAVRSRMRENEETIRFGESPRRKDKTLSDLFLGNTRNIATPKWSDATHSPRKGKVSRRARPPIPPTKAEKSTRRTDSTAHLQGYLRKMCRQKRVGDSQDYVSPRGRSLNEYNSPRQRRPVNHQRAGVSFDKQPQLIAQQA